MSDFAKDTNVPDKNVGDTISRQAAITTLCERRCGNKPKGCPSGFCTESLAVDCIPSAQPEPCEDAVSRRRLLGDLKELISAWKKYPVMAEQIKGVETAIGYVERIPPVTPQPEQRWIPVTERLPEHGIDVLTVDGYGEYELNHIIDDEGEWIMEHTAQGRYLPKQELIRCAQCEYYKHSGISDHYVCRYIIGESIIRRPADFCSRARKKGE